MSADEILLRVEAVNLAFETRGRRMPVLRDISLDVRRGEFIALLGPSGCGKSTLLNVVAGLVKPDSGKVWYAGKPLETLNRGAGYMTQDDTLLPWRTVEENISVPLELRYHRDRWADRRKLVRFYVDLVGLRGFEKFHIRRLSGGMRKRVALARTLIYDPELLLMDEPFGALDAQLKLVMQNELLRIWEKTRKTILFVTHDLAEAIVLADRVAVFTGRPGMIRAVMPVELRRPRNAAEIHNAPQYGMMYSELWRLLEPSLTQSADESSLGGDPMNTHGERAQL